MALIPPGCQFAGCSGEMHPELDETALFGSEPEPLELALFGSEPESPDLDETALFGSESEPLDFDSSGDENPEAPASEPTVESAPLTPSGNPNGLPLRRLTCKQRAPEYGPPKRPAMSAEPKETHRGVDGRNAITPCVLGKPAH